MKMKLLLHSCCAPCSSAVIERLLPDYDLTVFFFNPNILPKSEYHKRLAEQKRLLELLGNVPIIVGDYIHEKFASLICGLETLPENGERCKLCYRFRLSETARIAKLHDYDIFTTTLTLSSKKKAADINEIAAAIAKEHSLDVLLADFKKKDGYNRSIELCNRFGLYRQSYCGCVLHQRREVMQQSDRPTTV
jgi:hypothetical protein